jgi:hypothetical protein
LIAEFLSIGVSYIQLRALLLAKRLYLMITRNYTPIFNPPIRKDYRHPKTGAAITAGLRLVSEILKVLLN